MSFFAPMFEPRVLGGFALVVLFAVWSWWDNRRLARRERSRLERQFAGNRSERPGRWQ